MKFKWEVIVTDGENKWHTRQYANGTQFWDLPIRFFHKPIQYLRFFLTGVG